jgi:hypothetical protein
VSAKPIRIVDFCDELHRLNHLDKWDEGDCEFDRICRDVFGFTIEEIPTEQLNALDQELCMQAEALRVARQAGFDLTLNGFAPIPDWEDFWTCVRAKVRGLVPDDPLERARIRLENEALNFSAGTGC